jgi:hypothetical protein
MALRLVVPKTIEFVAEAQLPTEIGELPRDEEGEDGPPRQRRLTPNMALGGPQCGMELVSERRSRDRAVVPVH